VSVATVIETARVEQLVQGDHEYDRSWQPVEAFRADRRREPRVLLSEWLHDNRPPSGTYRLLTSWGARSDEITYRGGVA
jgi:hypothetical protein